MYKLVPILTIIVIAYCQDLSFLESLRNRHNSAYNSEFHQNTEYRQNTGVRQSPEIQQNSRHNPEFHQNTEYRQSLGVRRSFELNTGHSPEFHQNTEYRQSTGVRRSPELQSNSGYRQNSDFQANARVRQNSDQQQNGFRRNSEIEQRGERRKDYEQNSEFGLSSGVAQRDERYEQNSEFRPTPRRRPELHQSTDFQQNSRRTSDEESDSQGNFNNRRNSGLDSNPNRQKSPKQENSDTHSARVPVYAPDKCPENQLLYPEKEDNWICDCGPGYLYHAPSDGCFPAYRKGPCSRGYHLVLKKNKSVPDCVSNPCKDGYARYDGKCHELGKTNGPCPPPEAGGGVLGVNTTTLLVECIPGTNKLSLFDIPPNVQKCPPGSKRDSQNKCRQNWNITSV